MAMKSDQFPVEQKNVHFSSEASLCDVGIRVLGRGDTLYYQQGHAWFTAEMSATTGHIRISTVTKWGDGGKISSEERLAITRNIEALYIKHYGDNPIFV